MSSKPHGRKQPRSRIPVRVGGLEATLTTFRAELLNEIGMKTAVLLERYDQLKAAPLRARLDWLEKPLWRRVWIRLGRGWTWLRSGEARKWLKAKCREPSTAPASDTTTSAPTHVTLT